MDAIGLDLVSCPSSSFCAAIDNRGDAVTYNGTTWSPPDKVGPGTFVSLSCPSATFCLVITTRSHVFTFNGKTWSETGTLPGRRVGAEAACQTDNGCEALGGNQWLTDRDGVWRHSGRTDFVYGANAFSCASQRFCAAVDRLGYAATYEHGVWSKPIDVTGFDLFAVSCATNTLCAAGTDGAIAMYDGTHWSIRHPHGAGSLFAMSCSGIGFCVALDLGGHAFTYDDGLWGRLVNLPGEAPYKNGVGKLTGLSCSSPTWCVAIDKLGRVLTRS